MDIISKLQDKEAEGVKSVFIKLLPEKNQIDSGCLHLCFCYTNRLLSDCCSIDAYPEITT